MCCVLPVHSPLDAVWMMTDTTLVDRYRQYFSVVRSDTHGLNKVVYNLRFRRFSREWAFLVPSALCGNAYGTALTIDMNFCEILTS